MVRRYYITGGNNAGDPAVNASSVTDHFFVGKQITGVFKEGFRYYVPGIEWDVSNNLEIGDTVNILNGTQLERDEVLIVEVGPVQNGTTCTGSGTPVLGVEPYLPDIIKCVAARVNTVFETRDDDPFSVHYDNGLYNQVGNDRLKDNSGFYIIWLVMPYPEDVAEDDSYFADASCEVFIAAPTEANYTQQDREDINFYPRLIPIYRQFIEELKHEPKLDNLTVRHTRTLLPYWGGGAVAGTGQPNLWKNFVDCIKISGLKLKIKNIKNCTVFKSF